MSYRREDISNAIWDDEDFDALSDSAALLYLWSFTNVRCGMAGVYRVKRRDICEGRIKGKRLDATLTELRESQHFYYVDGFAWVRTRVKHLRTRGEPMKQSIRKDLASLPPGHPFTEAFCHQYEASWIADVVRGIRGVRGGSEGGPENGLGSEDSGTPPDPLEGSQGRGRGLGGGRK